MRALLAVALTFVASSAQAAGLVTDAAHVGQPSLQADVARARAADPASFDLVVGLARRAATRDAASRARKAPLALVLGRLGPRAVMPLVELVALDARGVDAGQRKDLVEALGILRDGRAFPVLAAALDDPDAEMTRTATEALGRLGSDAAVSSIEAALARANGPRATAVLAGMGDCRRVAIARTLADRAAVADDATAEVLARSLGSVGSAWAWKTLADRTEEAETRSVAARALVDLFVRRPNARLAAAKAILVVDDPSSATLLSAARSASSPDTAPAIDALFVKLASNPSRLP